MSEPQAYTVVSVDYVQDKPDTGYGPMKSIDVTLEGVGKVNWYAKAATNLPAPGSTLTGTIEQGQYGPKFKKAKPQEQGSFGSSGGARRQHDPDQDRRIQRQWSLKAALALAAEARERGISVDQCFDHIRALADRMESEIQSVAAPAAPGRTPEPPVPSEGPLAGDSGNGQSDEVAAAQAAYEREPQW